MKLLTLSIISFFLLLSCRTTKPAPDTSTDVVVTLDIFDHYWKLTEIGGDPVSGTNREPHLVLKYDEKRVTGNGGCNSFFGTMAYVGGDSIKFSGIGSTKMACPNMEVESKYFQALQQTAGFTLEDGSLILKNEDGTEVLRFVRTGK